MSNATRLFLHTFAAAYRAGRPYCRVRSGRSARALAGLLQEVGLIQRILPIDGGLSLELRPIDGEFTPRQPRVRLLFPPKGRPTRLSLADLRLRLQRHPHRMDLVGTPAGPVTSHEAVRRGMGGLQLCTIALLWLTKVHRKHFDLD